MNASTEVDKVSEALVKFQASVSNPAKDKKANIPGKNGKQGYSYEYAALPDILDQLRPLLAAQGLACTQSVGNYDGWVGCITTLVHESGQWMESDTFRLPSGDTPQTAGGASTYARRYSLTAFLGIAADEDDDGQRTVAHSYEDAVTQGAPAPKGSKAKGGGGVTEPQMKAIHRLGKDVGLDHEQLRARTGLASMNDLTTSDAGTLIEELQAEKKAGVKHEPTPATEASEPPAEPVDAKSFGGIDNKQLNEMSSLSEAKAIPAEEVVQLAANEYGVDKLQDLSHGDADALIALLEAEEARA